MGPAEPREVAEGVLCSPTNMRCEERRIREHVSMDGGGGRHCAAEQQAASGHQCAANSGESLLCFPPLHRQKPPTAIAPHDFG